MSKTQLVTFTPTDAFFFGGESTFGSGDNRNFYAASNAFPQQTTLVGVLRHALYEAGYPDDIGQSFRVNGTPDFGFLKKVSPVFIYCQKDNTYALPISLPNNEAGKSQPLEVGSTINSTMQVNFGNAWQVAPKVGIYKEKYGMGAKLLFSNGKLEDYDKVFEEVTKTGIARNRKTHITEEGMFYQQTLFKLKSGYAFGSYVTGTDELFETVQRRNMPMGGEKKNFVLQTYEINKSLDKLFYAAIKEHAIQGEQTWVCLTSDAYVKPDIYGYCHLAVSDTQPFRNIITPDRRNYTAALAKVKDNKLRYKSKQFTLLKRGTVLFPKENELAEDGTITINYLDKITTELTDTNFQAIGYNHYFTNPKTI